MPDPDGPPADSAGAEEAMHITRTTADERREDDQQEDEDQ